MRTHIYTYARIYYTCMYARSPYYPTTAGGEKFLWKKIWEGIGEGGRNLGKEWEFRPFPAMIPIKI